MDRLITITRAETTHVEQNWRQGGGRVLTFDVMLEMPQSQKVAVLGLRSEIIFDGKRYIVHQKEVFRKAPPEMVRLLLTKADDAAETWPTHSRRHGSPTFLSRVGNVPSFSTHAEVTNALNTHAERRR